MIPIGMFSELTGLSAKALRHYHSHGVLVPARVDEDTQFRWYTLDQVERAEWIRVLRRAGLGLDDVRRAADDPALAPEVLRGHAEELERRRREEDRALAQASDALAWEPVVRVRTREAVEALTAFTAESGPDHDVDLAGAEARALAGTLRGLAGERGWELRGRWWRTLEPVRGSGGSRARERVCVPVVASDTAAPLPEGVELVEYGEGPEAYLLAPGPETLGSYALTLSHLFRYEAEGMFADVAALRQVEYENGVEYSVGLRPMPLE